jgi:hypothetical protein
MREKSTVQRSRTAVHRRRFQREFVVIQTHLQSLMQELLRQNSTDEEQ